MHATLEAYAEQGTAEDFDCIVMSGVLHEVGDADRLMRAARRLARPGTALHVNVPNALSLHRLLGVEMGLLHSPFETSELGARLQRKREFDLPSLISLLRMHGYEPFETGSYFVKPFTHAQMEQLMSLGVLDERVLDALYSVTRFLPHLGAEIFVNSRLS